MSTMQPELLPAEAPAAPAPEKTTKMTRRATKTTAIAVAAPPPSDEWLAMLERLATNPDVDLTKIEKLIDLKERTAKTEAEALFNAAYAKMQAELPEIDERGKIVADGALRSTYARFEDIMRAVRPIMGKHGFGIRFEHTREGTAQVCTGILSHEAGHSISDKFEALPDAGGNKPAIQANGSTRSYGQRYTLVALLGIATRNQDDDGRTSQAPDAPAGFDEWWSTMEAVADEGLAKLEETWRKSNKEFTAYVRQHKVADWSGLKRKADKVVPRA